jgi:hypothetical protein
LFPIHKFIIVYTFILLGLNAKPAGKATPTRGLVPTLGPFVSSGSQRAERPRRSVTCSTSFTVLIFGPHLSDI